MKSVKILLACLAAILVFSTLAYAEVPKMINYQGKITTPQGALISDTFSMVFSIYADSTGGTPLWTETQPSVKVEYGVFSVLLGSVNPIPATVFDGDTRYLGLKVRNDNEMTPRKAIVSVGYAYNADMLDGYYPGNSNGQIPLSNGSLNATLNADMVDGKHASELGILPSKVYDSGWFAVAINSTYTKAHGLGTNKLLVNIYYSNTGDGSGDVLAINSGAAPNASLSNNKQLSIVDLDSTNIVVRTGPEIVEYVDSVGNWQRKTSGYCRIIALALE